MEKIIVTGVNGFVGKCVADKLLDMGYYVIGIGRRELSVDRDNYLYIKTDIRNKDDVENMFEQVGECRAVVHMAADINIKGNDNTILTNCLGTYYLASEAAKREVECFINFSSIPVIGDTVDIPIDESNFVNPKTVYHSTKYAAEGFVENICKDKIRGLNFRISSPVGVGMNEKNFLSLLIEKSEKNEEIELFGSGNRVQNYIDVRDIATAVICGINSNEKGLFLIAGKESYKNIQLAKECVEIIRSNSKIVCGRKKDPEEEMKWIISGEKARKQLGFEPEYSIDDTILWIVNCNKNK